MAKSTLFNVARNAAHQAASAAHLVPSHVVAPQAHHASLSHRALSTTAFSSTRAVGFDWDLTLSDSIKTYQEMANTTIAHLNADLPKHRQITPLTVDEFARSHSTEEMFDKRFQHDPKQKKKAIELYYDLFNKTEIKEEVLLPHTRELLTTLKDMNVPVFLVSNLEKCMLRKQIEALNIRHLLVASIGAIPGKLPKPYPDPIIAALEKAKISPDAEVLYIGDSATDIEAAHAAKLSSGLYNHHKFDEAKVSRIKPHLVIPSSDTFTSILADRIQRGQSSFVAREESRQALNKAIDGARRD